MKKLIIGSLIWFSCSSYKLYSHHVNTFSSCTFTVKEESHNSGIVIEYLMAYNLDLAQRILDAHKLLPAERFCSTFRDVDIRVRDLPYWYEFDDKGQIGEVEGDYSKNEIRLNRSGSSLLHEMLHHLGMRHYSPGFREADLEYKNSFIRLDD